MGIIKENIKYIWISLVAIIGWLLIEMPLMYFLVGVLGSNPYIFAIPAILGFLIMFCIEHNFVSSEMITARKFIVFVYAIPEIVIILSSFIATLASRGQEGFAYSLGSLMQFGAILVAITIALRAMAFATQKFISKMESNL